MRIEVDDLSRPEVHALLEEHLQEMHEITPRESIHALDPNALRGPDITFWSVWDDTVLVGCGAASTRASDSRSASLSRATRRIRTACS